jgi:hypothetical protein
MSGNPGLNQHPFRYFRPVGDIDRLPGQRELVESFDRVEPGDDNFHGVAGIRRRLELLHRKNALAAASQVDKHIIAMDRQHLGLHASVRLQLLHGHCIGGIHHVVDRHSAHGLEHLHFQIGRELLADIRHGRCLGRGRRLDGLILRLGSYPGSARTLRPDLHPHARPRAGGGLVGCGFSRRRVRIGRGRSRLACHVGRRLAGLGRCAPWFGRGRDIGTRRVGMLVAHQKMLGR